jgi:hypothetical protein
MSDFLDAHSGEGFEDFGANSYQVPFLKIAQTLSPEVKKQNASYIEGLEPGSFFNTLTKKVYGSTIELIPLRQKEVWLEFEPNQGPYRGMHLPGSIPTSGNQYEDGLKTLKGNTLIDALVFYCLIATELDSGPIIFTLYGSGFRHAKTWNSLIMTTKTSSGKQAPYFGSVWELSTSYNQNDRGDWFQIGAAKSTNVKRIRSITEDELNLHILPARNLLKDIDKQADFSLASPDSRPAISAPKASIENSDY